MNSHKEAQEAQNMPSFCAFCAFLWLIRVWSKPQSCQYSCAESEYAYDVMFESPAALRRIYPSLVHHAMLSFGAEQVWYSAPVPSPT